MWKDEISKKRSFSPRYNKTEKRIAIEQVMESLNDTIFIAERYDKSMKLGILEFLSEAKTKLAERYRTIQGD